MDDRPAAEVRTTCPYCGVGCGVLAGVAAGGSVSVRGDPDHPANRGRLCSKGSALGETTGLDGRFLSPMIAGRASSWDAALDLVSSTFARTVERHGPDSVAFYVSGQLLTEDYYVANKLMKGFIGSANIDTNSRLCMASSVGGHRRAFGEDIVPGTYEDLDEADLIVLAGSNTAWCHPILFRRMLAARERRGTRIVVIDPRRTATADDCDLHLALKPGSDVLLFNGLLVHLAHAGAVDPAYLAAHTAEFAEALAAAQQDAPSVEDAAEGCDVPRAALQAFYELFASTKRVVTVYSQGVNQSTRGTDKVNAIINCHLATGRIGRPGMGPFSVTGQPNAMGGREVGGLANQLAAHMAFDDPADIDRVSRFWGAPAIATRPGLKAVDLFRAVGDGRIRALWIMGTNPAVSMPDAGKVRSALKDCDFVVVSDVTQTDTTRLADVLLPAAGWGEKDGTVTNSERRISRQRHFLPLPGEALPDWRIVCEVARRMGFGPAFSYDCAAAIFREHAALSTFENDGARLFDIGAHADIPDAAYETLAPLHWPCRPTASPSRTEERLFGDGNFPTTDGRARFVAVRYVGVAKEVSGDLPISLNTGRLRDHWHTMTRTGRVARLGSHAPEPVLELHPVDARQNDILDGDLVELSSPQGKVRAKAHISDALKPGQAFLPMHWSGDFAAKASAGFVSSPSTDAVSGQPELKHVPVAVTRIDVAWEAAFLSQRDIRPTGFLHWSRRVVEGGWVYSLCGSETPAQGAMLARVLFAGSEPRAEIEYTDRSAETYRAARLDASGALSEALLVAPPRRLPDPDWFLALLASRAPLSPAERRALLSARASVPAPSRGRIVCACFNVGENQIAAAIADGCVSVEAVGARLSAGTNCGSCRSEIRTFIDAAHLQAAQ